MVRPQRRRRARGWALGILVALLLALISSPHTSGNPVEVSEIEWTRQFGTSALDIAWAAAVDGSGVYVAGSTGGAFLGQMSAGDSDAFLSKHDAAGTEMWIRQFGSSAFDGAFAIAVDGSGVYVAGFTFGTLPGQTSAGLSDAFLRKYDANGNEVWTRQFGSSGVDEGLAVAVDGSGVYVAGRTSGSLPGQTSAGLGLSDAFLRKYDANGNEVWTRQFGSPAIDEAPAVAVDGSGVYVAGRTDGTLPGQTTAGSIDAFLRKYDAAGTEVWTRQFATSSADLARAVAVDGSGVYVAGHTGGDLEGTNAGGGDAFLRKYDAAGTEVWSRQFGSSDFDSAGSVTVYGSGVHVAGRTFGTLTGQTSTGLSDAFLRKYDANGNEVWTRQFGTFGVLPALANAVAVDGSGVYVAGRTFGTLPGQTSAGDFDGDFDAFIRKYNGGGTEAWTRQFGTSEFDFANAVAVDGSGVYVAGRTDGDLEGTNAGGGDAFLRKYDAAGTEVWTRQFGSPTLDEANAIAVEEFGVYVAGSTFGTLPGQVSAGGLSDAFVRKYDAAGTEVWTRQFGTSGVDAASAVAVDGSGVYVVGITDGTLPGETSAGGEDAFVRKYDAAGNVLWTDQFGSSAFGFSQPDRATGVAVDPSGVYVAGRVGGTLPGQTPAGGTDVFLRKYDAAGTEVWTRQFGTSTFDEAFAAAVDGSGVYVAGRTFGAFPGQTSAGDFDAFLRKYDAAGTEVWTRQFGSSAIDEAFAIAVDGSGVYVAGRTAGTLPNQADAGGTDAFVTKIVTPALEVFPASVEFGDIAVGSSSTAVVTLSSIGNAPVSVTGIALASGTAGFAVTSGPATPFTIPFGGTVDVGVTFAPTVAGAAADTLRVEITGDANVAVAEVPLNGNGIPVELPPQQQIQEILDFFDAAVAAGTLVGSGPGGSSAGRLGALRNMLEVADDLIQAEDIAGACDQLRDVYLRTDGNPRPPDFVSGTAAADLAAMILALMDSLGCP